MSVSVIESYVILLWKPSTNYIALRIDFILS